LEPELIGEFAPRVIHAESHIVLLPFILNLNVFDPLSIVSNSWKDLQISDPVHATLPSLELSDVLEEHVLVEEARIPCVDRFL
jgi:hypothetical protein